MTGAGGQGPAVGRSWWTPVVPLFATVALVLTAVLGSALSGWAA